MTHQRRFSPQLPMMGFAPAPTILAEMEKLKARIDPIKADYQLWKPFDATIRLSRQFNRAAIRRQASPQGIAAAGRSFSYLFEINESSGASRRNRRVTLLHALRLCGRPCDTLAEEHLPARLVLAVRPWLDGLRMLRGLFPSGIEKLAFNAQARRYERMADVFRRAFNVLPAQFDPADARRIHDVVRELGTEAMRDNAEWVSTYRERPFSLPQS